MDVCTAVLVLGIGAISHPTISFHTAEQAVYSLIVFGCAAALVFRRAMPLFSLASVGALLLVHLVILGDPNVFAAAACMVAVYTSQTRLTGATRWLYTVAIYLGACVATFGSSLLSDSEWTHRVLTVAGAAALLSVAALTGVIRRHKREQYNNALAHVASLEARREAERKLAAAQERARIATEMHDVLGHSLNTIAMQAEGLRYLTDPDSVDRSLADLGRLSRQAVDDVRHLIDVLSAQHDPECEPPTSSLHDVAAIVSDLGGAGFSIRLHIDGELADVPGHVSFTGYRIAQEALTNVLKHAPGASVTVRIVVATDSVDVTVLNTPAGRASADQARGSGHGITGMRERAHKLGGTVTVGPDPQTHAWRVTATLPWSRS